MHSCRALSIALLIGVIGISGILASPRDNKDHLNKKKTSVLKTRSELPHNENQTVKEVSELSSSSSDSDSPINLNGTMVVDNKNSSSVVPADSKDKNKDKDNNRPLDAMLADLGQIATISTSGPSESGGSGSGSGENQPQDIHTILASNITEIAEKEPSILEDGGSSDKERPFDMSLQHTSADTTVPSPPKQNYFIARFKNVIKQFLLLMGFSQKKKSRMFDYAFNGGPAMDRDVYNPIRKIGNAYEGNALPYTDDVRATVGAILGRRDCYRRAFCGAGTYLREVKGKEVIIVLLEKILPKSWSDMVNHVKEAAIYRDPCDYECLED